MTYVKQKSTFPLVKTKKPRMGRPRLAADTAFYGVRMPASVMAEVDHRARETGVTRSELLRQLIVVGLAAKRRKS